MDDRVTVTAEPPGGVSAANRKWVFVATLVTSFMAAIESTIVATAVPSIVGALGDFDLLSWVFTSYLLTQAATVPIYGRLSDLYGRKRLLFIGIALFLAGSVLCGLAWNMPSLILFRVLQGLGSGAVLPVAQTLMGDIYRGADRSRMQGYISSTFGSAALLGPIVGAFIVAHWSWAWIFWVNVPLGIASLIMLQLTLKERVAATRRRIDYRGSTLLAAGTGLLMYALGEAPSLTAGWLAAITVAAVAILVWFVAHEMQESDPVLPLALMRRPLIACGNLSGIVSGAVMMGIAAYLPAYMQVAMGASVLASGYALMALSVGWPIGGFTAGRVSLVWTYRTATFSGSIVLILGSLLMVLLDPGRGVAWAVASTFLTGFGLGLANNTWAVAAQANVEWHQRGVATSSIVFTRIIGQSLGTAIYGGIVNAGLARHIHGAGDLVSRILDPAQRAQIPAAIVVPLMADFSHALHAVYEINLALAIVCLATVLGMPRGLTPQGASARS